MADAFDLLTNPMGAVKAGVRAGLLKMGAINKDPEALLQGTFEKIGNYKNLAKGIKPQVNLLPNIGKNLVSGGLIKTGFSQQNSSK